MSSKHQDFARALVSDLLAGRTGLCAHPDSSRKVIAKRGDGSWASLDLTPFEAEPMPVTAQNFFQYVDTTAGLLDAYRAARDSIPFEDDLKGALDHVDGYSGRYLWDLLERARETVADRDARLVAAWVSRLDTYTAVKAVESLLKSKADLMLLKVAEPNGWTIHFDHLAIRCGSGARGDAERVVENLRANHGYVASHVPGEDYYRFDDGWNAYVLYKMLENRQTLRLFIDQSDPDNKTQIIQHWNNVYGYTAHHLGIRATRQINGGCGAVPLDHLVRALADRGVAAMTPTGEYTDGLLLQVFTSPERNRDIPEHVLAKLRSHAGDLEASIENGKLLELLSRREMSHDLKGRFFELYGLTYEADNPLHSAPAYTYFLPAQAAHVIRTSIEVD